MGKTGISKRQKKSVGKYLKVHVPFSSEELKDPHQVAELLLDCIKTGELDSFRDVLISHLITANKTDIAKKAGLGRRTIYDLLDPKKDFNPELSTISAVIRALVA